MSSPESVEEAVVYDIRKSGIQCPEPGVYYNVANSVYQAWKWYSRGDIPNPDTVEGGFIEVFDETLSNSMLGDLEYPSTPLHARYKWDLPVLGLGEPEKRWSNLDLGSAFHTRTLEPDRWLQDVMVHDKIEQRGKAGKAAYMEFIIKHGGKAIITPEQEELVLGMEDSVRKHPTAGPMFENKGETEVSIVADHGGERIRCRIDKVYRLGDLVMYVDLKSEGKQGNAHPELWGKKIANYGYHRQGGIYSKLGDEALGVESKAFVFVVVEVEPPHPVSVLKLDNHARWLGYGEFMQLLHLYSECKRQDEWPAYSVNIEEVNLPDWKLASLERQQEKFARELQAIELANELEDEA